MKYYVKALQKYAVFTGRAERAEFWYFFLYHLLISFVIGRFDAIFGVDLLSIYYPALFIPTIAVGVRRMHDVEKSGWYVLIPFYNLILAAWDGSKGENKYGSNHNELSYE
jgi:uncharacterized membrane protein YhaH (DUF805 family)